MCRAEHREVADVEPMYHEVLVDEMHRQSTTPGHCDGFVMRPLCAAVSYQAGCTRSNGRSWSYHTAESRLDLERQREIGKAYNLRGQR
jgi:hypothetical protein